MKAVVWRGERTVDIETVEDARLEAPTDVLLRLTSAAICGTDLHIYEGVWGKSMPIVSVLQWSIIPCWKSSTTF